MCICSHCLKLRMHRKQVTKKPLFYVLLSAIYGAKTAENCSQEGEVVEIKISVFLEWNISNKVCSKTILTQNYGSPLTPNIVMVPEETNLNVLVNCSWENLAVIDSELWKYLHFCSEIFGSYKKKKKSYQELWYCLPPWHYWQSRMTPVSFSTVIHDGYNY